jgi:hypothetical protein
MAKKVEITLTHAQADATIAALQSIAKQTNTIAALIDIVEVAEGDQFDSKKVALAFPASKAAALAKALAAVPKQTKTVEKLGSIVTAAIAAYDDVLAAASVPDDSPVV